MNLGNGFEVKRLQWALGVPERDYGLDCEQEPTLMQAYRGLIHGQCLMEAEMRRFAERRKKALRENREDTSLTPGEPFIKVEALNPWGEKRKHIFRHVGRDESGFYDSEAIEVETHGVELNFARHWFIPHRHGTTELETTFEPEGAEVYMGLKTSFLGDSVVSQVAEKFKKGVYGSTKLYRVTQASDGGMWYQSKSVEHHFKQGRQLTPGSVRLPQTRYRPEFEERNYFAVTKLNPLDYQVTTDCVSEHNSLPVEIDITTYERGNLAIANIINVDGNERCHELNWQYAR